MRKWIIIGVVVALVVVGGIVVASAQSGSDSGAKPVLITDVAVVRDLTDEVTVPGTLERAEQRTVSWLGGGGGGQSATSASASVVSAEYLDDGAPLNPGDRILAVDGRASVAFPGLFPFFRKLDVGAEGLDVQQLKTILAADGFQPGPADTRYTEQTRFALSQWQAARGYPGSTPSTSQTVNVALQQGAGYELGPQTSAGLTIGPPPARKAAARTGVGAQALPEISIGASTTSTARGAFVSFNLVSDIPVLADLTVTVALGGTLASGDRIPAAATQTVTIPTGGTTATLQVFILPNASAPAQTLTGTVQADPGNLYTVGTPSVASITVQSSVTPTITVSGTTTIQPGQSTVVTIAASSAPTDDLLVNLSVGGSAQADVDYVAFPPNVVIPAGQTSATVTVQAKTSSTIKPDRFLIVGVAQGSGYTPGGPGSATVTIQGSAGSVVPVVTIGASNLRVNAGTPAQFGISLDRPLTQPLELTLAYGGDAVMGSDYNPPPGIVTVPANQTSLTVAMPTLNNGLVQPDTTLVVAIAPQSTYVVGNPSAASTVIVNQTKPKISIYGGGANVSLGGGVAFTVVADQPSYKDISIQYTVTGTAQQGKDIQPVTGSVILPAGSTQVSIPILTLNTNVYFLPTDIIVTTGGGRLGQLLVKEGDVVPAGTPLFTITEPNIAVTLNASAADRTKLKVGQTATVQVQGGASSAPGVITELDDFPTTDPETRQQTFKGKVQVQGDLGAADGTPVTVNVVVQERKGVLTVPIAAVKQNGSGVDVIRLIDLETGKTREVEVETGLTEGSYIEVKKGIAVNDVVVIELEEKS
ncbi:MAG: HlyD family efflux transporter periplasmic adaptor subunit [Actinobacteria bacterium]|nr:HlyD family efflux transporter periplasmic adaptor subunit [Actinomycetota bacterium]